MNTYEANAPTIEANRRVSGQFGNKHQSPTEVSVEAVTPAVLEDVWETRKECATALDEAAVAVCAANLPDEIKGIRFVVKDGQLIPVLYIPTVEGGPVPVGEFHELHTPVLTALAQEKRSVVLDPVYERNGTQAWEWVPSAEERAVDPADADEAKVEALLDFRAVHEEFNTKAETYLRQNIPDGIAAIEVAYGPEKDANGRYISVPTMVNSFGTDGEQKLFNTHTPEMRDYKLNLARTSLERFPVTYHEVTHAASYMITRAA